MDGGSREVKRQLLQTFNMLVQNINNDQVINLIIVHYIKDIIKCALVSHAADNPPHWPRVADCLFPASIRS
jgi:hypothetical protein